MLIEICDLVAVYGAHGGKIWRELHRQSRQVARCTVERLMRELGFAGAMRGIPGGQVERAPDPVERDLVAPAPKRCWVVDLAP